MSLDEQGPQDGDAALLAELGAAFARAERPPGHVVDAAKAAFSMRALDAELALLTWDSEIDAAPAAVRGPAGPATASYYRSLTFELSTGPEPTGVRQDGESLSVEVEVGPAALGRPLTGQLVPPRAAVVLALFDAGPTVRMPADEVGRFAAVRLPAGLLRLRVGCPGLPPVVTSWIRLG